ncbi:MAG: ATP-dependent helicase HrpB [bacterium]|nr:ATP-dependent helicase HrpB [bacterium]
MNNKEITSLPIYPYLDDIIKSLEQNSTLMLHAETGAGKTTLLPWKIIAYPAFKNSKILLLQPRRIAARAAAERIAALLGEKVGRSVGLRTRHETLVSSATRLEVVTEGILTRIIQNDQSLENYGIIIFDEFHERNLQGDTGLAFAWDCRETLRPDLKIIFMSATLPAKELRTVFGDIPVISVPGRTYPVAVSYHEPGSNEKIQEGVVRLVKEAGLLLSSEKNNGDILVFLPGFREINRSRKLLETIQPGYEHNIFILHGRLQPEEQRKVLAPEFANSGRIILATNVAETSLTIPGVRAVIDMGLERRVRFQARTGMDHWDTSAISNASAEQRKGRAGRLGPGFCLRWWSEAEPRSDFSLPEIMEADLSPLVLETALWGARSPYDLKWLTPPPKGSVQRASGLLKELALADGEERITAQGKKAARMGLHPRLGRMILSALDKGWISTAALTAAILEEGDPLKGTDPDFRDRLSAWASWESGKSGSLPGGAARRIEGEARRIIRSAGLDPGILRGSSIDPGLAGKLLLLAYPDRAAQRVKGSGDGYRLVFVTGRGARIRGDLANEEFLAAAEIDGGETEATIFLAAPVTLDDLESGFAGAPVEKNIIEWSGWIPRSRTERCVGRIKLRENLRSLSSSDLSGSTGLIEELHQAVLERLRREGLEQLPWSSNARRFCARCCFVQKYGSQKDWPHFSMKALSREMENWLLPSGNWTGGSVFTEESVLLGLKHRLGWERAAVLDKLAPEMIELPSGSKKTLDYESGDIPVLAARLQEFFGCRETPVLCGEPLLLHLLNPASRPVQITRDLDGFWDRAYPEVKKELKGRYPRHYWPDNPREAEATARAKPRKSR